MKSQTFVEPRHLSDLLLVEVCPGWTKEYAMVKASATPIEIGTVLTLDEDYVQYDPAKTTARLAIAAEHVYASDTEQPIVVICRGAVVHADELRFPEGTTDEQIAQAIDTLLSQGIAVQTSQS